jgi:hypothetical protein
MNQQTKCIAATLFAAMVVGCGDTARQADASRPVDSARPAKPTAVAAAKPVAATVVLSVPGMT